MPRLPTAVLVLVALFLGGGAARADEPHPAARGVLSGPIEKLLSPDAEAHAAASAALRARGSFALPYVVSAAESTADDAARERLLALAREIRSAGPDPDPLGDPPGGAEFPEWDVVALNQWRQSRAARAREAIRISDPLSPAAARILVEEERWAEALGLLVQLVRTSPKHREEALRIAAHGSFHGRDEVAELVADLDRAAAECEAKAPRASAGRLAWLRARWWRRDRQARLRAVAAEYGEEPAGLLALRDLLAEYGENAAAEVRDLISFAGDHPGTEAARLALEEAAFQYRFNLATKGEDQAERLRTIADLAARLQSDEFAGPEGGLAAVRNLAELYLRTEPIPAEAAREMLGFYREFFRHHFLLDDIEGPGCPVGYHLASKLGRFHRELGVAEGDLPQVLDAELAALEEALPAQAAVRYLRACDWAERGLEERALEALEAIEREFPGRLYARKALAARATFLYARGRFAAAEKLYRRYVTQHPESPYVWVAALRTAYCLAFQGKRADAEEELRAVRRIFAAEPLASGLAALGAARICEEDDRPADAARWYRDALPEVATRIQGVELRGRSGFDPDAPIDGAGLQARRELLERHAAEPEALVRFLRGGRLRRDGREEEALATWRALLREQPASALVPRIRAAQSELLLDRLLAATDSAALGSRLEEMVEAGDSFSRLAAELVRALVELSRDGGEETAPERLRAALGAFVKAEEYRDPEDDLDADVAAIRSLVFRPRENRFFRGEWSPRRTWPFVVADPAIPVEFYDGRRQIVTLRHRVPGQEGMVWLEREQIAAIGRILAAFGGGRRTKSPNPMAIPQPTGGAEAIQSLLDSCFMTLPGHWGGWEIETFPRLDRIVFREAARATAVAHFKVRYQGGEAEFTKVDGAWQLGEVRITWTE